MGWGAILVCVVWVGWCVRLWCLFCGFFVLEVACCVVYELDLWSGFVRFGEVGALWCTGCVYMASFFFVFRCWISFTV